MATRVTDDFVEDGLPVRRSLVQFPIELLAPPGFRPEEPATWPESAGRMEYVNGRILYMPPCGVIQQWTSADVTSLLTAWARAHPDFCVGGNEAGMKLGRDVRGADAAVWRRGELGAATAGFARVPPVLAVEVAGREEREGLLRDKARWYLDAGVEVVWLVLPETREVLVLTRDGETRHGLGQILGAHPALPGLLPPVVDFFAQLEQRR
ncbi:MAG: Uma2 family endonuclease [Deltaproteobacteria bacterium]|nr:Uma2 family endonuclease [Deltaproteobacteria bacterium]